MSEKPVISAIDVANKKAGLTFLDKAKIVLNAAFV